MTSIWRFNIIVDFYSNPDHSSKVDSGTGFSCKSDPVVARGLDLIPDPGQEHPEPQPGFYCNTLSEQKVRLRSRYIYIPFSLRYFVISGIFECEKVYL